MIDGLIAKFDVNGIINFLFWSNIYIGDYRDAIYFKDKFYLYDRSNTQIMIKEIDEGDVRPWFNHKGNGGWIGRTIRIGHSEDHLILSKEG